VSVRISGKTAKLDRIHRRQIRRPAAELITDEMSLRDLHKGAEKHSGHARQRLRTAAIS
jgi:hypothetical protein